MAPSASPSPEQDASTRTTPSSSGAARQACPPRSRSMYALSPGLTVLITLPSGVARTYRSARRGGFSTFATVQGSHRFYPVTTVPEASKVQCQPRPFDSQRSSQPPSHLQLRAADRPAIQPNRTLTGSSGTAIYRFPPPHHHDCPTLRSASSTS